MNFRRRFMSKLISYMMAASILMSTPLSAFAMPVSRTTNQPLTVSAMAIAQEAEDYGQVTTSTNFNDHIPGTWKGENVTATTESGDLKLNLSGISFAWHEESVYVADGSLEVTMNTSTDAGRVGVYLKPYGEDLGIRIAYDLKGEWIWQVGEEYGKLTTDGPEIKANQDYKIKVEFAGKDIKLSVDNELIAEKTIEAMPTGLKQWGIAKWFDKAVVTVKEVNFTGLGLKEAPVSPEKPVEHVTYFKDYQDGNTGKWAGGTPTIVQEGDNKVLKLKGSFGRIMDNDSPDIKNGTIKMKVKATETGRLGFGFRGIGNNNMVEIANDGGRWVAEFDGSWPDFFDTPKLTPNLWEDLMITFNEKVVTVYINDKMVAQKEFKDMPVREGKFGIRSWGEKEIFIDDLLYTSEVLEPAKLVKYENNFEYSIAGEWTAGSPKVVNDGNNKVLKLDFDKNAVSINNDSPEINNGSLRLKVKTTNGDGLGLGFRAKTNDDFQGIRYIDGSWKVVNGEKSTEYSAKAKFKANGWNSVLLNFKGKDVTMFVNGESYGTILAENLVDAKGKLGIIATTGSTVYVDDIVYTEETLEVDPNETVGRKEYRDSYDTPTSIDWTNATPVQKDGVLYFDLGAGGMAINNDTPNVLNGVYQAQFKKVTNGLGVVFGYVNENENTAIYHKENGTWAVKVNGNEEIIKTDGPVMRQGESGLLNIEVVEGIAKLRYNNKLVVEFAAKSLKEGKIGVINASNNTAKVELDMMSSYETFIYAPDYNSGTPNWIGTGAKLEGGKLKVSPARVATGFDQDSPKLTNQLIEFGFNTNVVGDMTGGRYGFVFRGVNEKDHASVTYDVNGQWHVNKSGANVGQFPVNFPMGANKDYDIKIKVVDQSVQLTIDGVSLGTVDAPIDVKPGYFGVKSWWGDKIMILSNLKITEIADYVPAELETVEKNISSEKLNVVFDDKFPRIIRYESKVSDGVLTGQEQKIYGLSVNNEVYYPEVEVVENTDNQITYKLSIPEIETSVTMRYTVKDNIVDFNVTEIKEDGDFRVMKLGIPNHGLITTNSTMKDATFATVKSDGRWYTDSSLPEEIVDDLAEMKPSDGAQGVTIGLLSGNGLAAGIENNVMTGGAKVMVEKNKLPQLNEVKMANGTWTYREHIKDDSKPGVKEHEELPWSKIVIGENANSEKKVDWQDAAIAYRDIMKPIFGAEQLKESMMYISFNFASQANSPFLTDLDTGKVLYNYTDGFGQMVMSKGYQGEGHDDAIPDYDKIGIRQGGVKDFNYLIDEGKKYNLDIGVHINATEYHLDAFETVFNNLHQPLRGGWDWIDPSYYVDQTKDVTTGELARRFKNLKDIAPGLNFAYIDVYTGNDWESRKLLETLEELEIVAGTEFAGPNEPGVTFTHWGPDLGYPNKGNTSKVMRFIKNELDLFTGKSLLKGQKIPGVTTWGDSKPDMKEGVHVFYNEVLPTKYMQHFGITRWDTNRVEFEQNVVSQRENGKIKLTKDGKLIAEWTDHGETTDPNQRHTSPTLGLIPWNPITEDKLYHWNPEGGQTTWDLPDSWSNVTSIDVYELSDTAKTKVKTLTPTGGKITIDAPKNTPYVLYKDGETPDLAAADWGEGSPVLDRGFDSREFEIWEKSSTAGTTDHVEIIRDQGTQGQGRSPWNNYLNIGAEDATITQEIEGLTAGEDHTVSIWAKVSPGREAGLEVEVDGITYKTTLTDSEEIHRSSFKYVGTKYQELRIKFNVPEDVTTATVKLTANAGAGNVEFDDAKIWEHPTKSLEDFEDFLVYEDFENVSRGWGVFEYGYAGSRRTHISDRDLSEDSKQHMHWVRDGQYSLKSNEDRNQQVLKTVETTLKFEPNTTYEMGMLHSIESGGSYNIAVKSKSGDIVLNEKLENVSNANGGTSYVAEFTTGDHDDYYVAITQNSDSGGARTIVIDNFWIMDQTEKVAATGVKLDAATKELKKEEKFQLNATVLPEGVTNKKVTWKSSNEEVATVKDGVVTAIDQGEAKITVTTEDGGFTDTCMITVLKEVVETKMSVDMTGNNSVKSGEKIDFTVSLDGITDPVYAQDITITYDATKFSFDSIKEIGLNQIIQIKEEDGSVRVLAAVIDEDGKSGEVGGLTGNPEIFKVSLLAKETNQATSATISVNAETGTVVDGTANLVSAGLAQKSIDITAKEGPIIPEVPDNTRLNSAIANAIIIMENAVVGTTAGKYPQSAKDALSAAIKVAEDVVRTDANQATLDKALATLNQAVNIFEASKIKGISGDINKDGKIDIADLALMAQYYTTKSGDTNWNYAKEADIVQDGVIDMKDIVHIARMILNLDK